MSDINAQWVSLAARVVRVALARKDVGYAELAKRLAEFGVTEDDKTLAARVAAGRVRLVLFLQILSAIDAELPQIWWPPIFANDTWDGRSRAVLEAERTQLAPMEIEELAQRLGELNAGFTQKTLVEHVTSGNLFLPEFLRCLVVLRSRSLDPYIEYRDLLAAARS
ncbi:hypothetical protein F506_20090 [Herbaspirillum hiltneri N3]|uniref:DUF6471 domain-containing protein n=1 Tax=Herbaspirillum hiltneri N3 TaxID=1262470 RepID=A0ABN4I0X8_9BURK|nr:DUF6471 domain-containing protein [Herbaspirillum hiltneri]AKZ64646.1 hypothetical protein F506_20090 [Herbaspirillum hiltneri N3]